MSHFFKISHWTVSHISIDADSVEDARADADTFARHKWGPAIATSLKPCDNPGGEFFTDHNDPDWAKLKLSENKS